MYLYTFVFIVVYENRDIYRLVVFCEFIYLSNRGHILCILSLMTNHGQFVIAQTCFFLSFNIHNKNSNLGKRTPVLDIYEDFMGGELFI